MCAAAADCTSGCKLVSHGFAVARALLALASFRVALDQLPKQPNMKQALKVGNLVANKAGTTANKAFTMSSQTI
jgi:hypothetical protein